MADRQLKSTGRVTPPEPKPLPPEERATLAWAEGDMQRPAAPTLSLDTLNRCAELWAGQTISPTSDDFEEVAVMLAQGRRELLAVLEEVTSRKEN